VEVDAAGGGIDVFAVPREHLGRRRRALTPHERRDQLAQPALLDAHVVVEEREHPRIAARARTLVARALKPSFLALTVRRTQGQRRRHSSTLPSSDALSIKWTSSFVLG